VKTIPGMMKEDRSQELKRTDEDESQLIEEDR